MARAIRSVVADVTRNCRRRICALALMAVAGVLTACSGETTRPTCPAGQACLLYGNGAEPETLDPAKGLGTWEGRIIDLLSEGLTRREADGGVGPGVARTWSVSADGLTWTFRLRKAIWSDGVALTADDFVYGIRRVLDPKTASQAAFMLYPIRNARQVSGGAAPLDALGVEAPAPDTLVIRLEHPWPVLPSWATHRILRPAPRHAIERWGAAWVKPGRYVGNGPYRLLSWKLGDRIVVRKNLSYSGPPACFEEIAFYPTTDMVTAERQIRTGELDLNMGVQSNRVRYLRRPDQLPQHLRMTPTTATAYVTFNLRDVPALRDVRVRRALSMSIDRAFITDKLLAGGQAPAFQFLPPGLADYSSTVRPYWQALSFPQRQAEARRLLRAAGYGPARPLGLTFKHMNSSDTMVFVPALQADWAAIGVRIGLEQNEVQVAYQAYETQDFEIGSAGWSSFDALNFLDLLKSSTGGQNYGLYTSAAYDALVTAAQFEVNDARRRALMGQAEQILMDDAPVAPLYFSSARSLVSPSLAGWIDNPLDFHPADKLCRNPAPSPVGVGRTE